MNSARNTEGGLNGAGKDGDQPHRLCALSRSRFASVHARTAFRCSQESPGHLLLTVVFIIGIQV